MKLKALIIRWYLKHKNVLIIILDALATCLVSLKPKQNIIVLESKPERSDNTYELFKYLLNNKINRKYHIFWLVDNYDDVTKEWEYNVECYPMHPRLLKEKIRLRYLLCAASCIVCSHRFAFPYFKRKNQMFFYLDHGSPMKDCKNIFVDSFREKCYYISQGRFFDDAISEQYNIKKNMILCLGLPRNDQLFRKYNTIHKVVPEAEKYNKIVIWAPTFRYHKERSRIDCHSDMPLGIPVCYSEDDMLHINDYLKQNDILLILKPHPAQDISLIVDMKCSNILVLYSDDLVSANIQTNELLAQTDALITDYSSIYYDYLLLDKPIAITLDDYQQYKEEMGFVFEKPLDVIKGDYIYSVEDLLEFFRSLVEGYDKTKNDRHEVLEMIDDHRDSSSTKRLYDYIIESGIL